MADATQWSKPFTDFRWATDEEKAHLDTHMASMRFYQNTDGWCHGYFDEVAFQAYYLDTTTGKWAIPQGD